MRLRPAFLLLIMLPVVASAQQDISLYALNNVFQQLYVNPSYLPKSKVHVGLPLVSSLYVRVSNTGFKLGEFLTANEQKVVDVNRALDQMGERNITALDFSTDLFSLGIKYNNIFFSLSASEKLSSSLVYKKDFFTLLFKGNGEELLGRRANFDETAFHMNLYHEIALGASLPIGEKLRFGFRAKYLMGALNATTTRSRLGLTTAEDNFTLTLDGSLAMNTSGFNNLKENGDDLDKYAWQILTRPGKNPGMAVDLGAEYYVSDRLSITASLLNIGYIRWTDDVTNYENDSILYTFSGIDVQDFGSVYFSDEFGKRLDTLEEKLKFTKSSNAYSSRMNSQLVLGGSLTINDNAAVGALWRSELIGKVLRPSLSFFYQFKISNWLGATVNYSYLNKSFVNLGAGFAIKLLPFQIYVASDNIMAPIALSTARGGQIRAGVNFAFGGKEVKRLRVPEPEEEL